MEGEFAKLRKTTVGFTVSGRPSVRLQGSTRLWLDEVSLTFTALASYRLGR